LFNDGERKTVFTPKDFKLNKENDQIYTRTISPTKYMTFTNNSLYANSNLGQKILSTKNEILNLRKEEEFISDFESKRLINRGNLGIFSPKKQPDEYRNFINNTLGIFKPSNEKQTKDTDSLANRIFNRNRSPLKSEIEPLALTNTFRKANKSDLFNERNDIHFNPKRHAFAEKRNELVNIIKSKPGSFNASDFQLAKNRMKERKGLGIESKIDTFVEKKPALSLKQMDTNLKYSKVDFCTYYSSQPKIRKQTNLSDYNFTKSQNKIAKLLNKFN